MGTWALARVSLGVFVEFSCVGFPSEMMPTVGAPSPDAQEVGLWRRVTNLGVTNKGFGPGPANGSGGDRCMPGRG